MKVVGLDVSTYIGMYLLGDGEDRGKEIHFKSITGFQRLDFIKKEVCRVLEIWQPKKAVIEGYAFGNTNSLVTLVECGTVVRHTLFSLKIPWVEVPPTTLKLWATSTIAFSLERHPYKSTSKKVCKECGEPAKSKRHKVLGKTDKEGMKSAVKERWGFESPSEHIIDAFAAAQIGHLSDAELFAVKGVTAGG